MNKFSNGKIYRLRSVVEGQDKVYIGSTTQTLYSRLNSHRHYANNCSSKKMFQDYGLPNVIIELICNYPCLTKKELLTREGQEIRGTECINVRIEGRTQKQYCIDKYEKVSKLKKDWYYNNIDKVKSMKTAIINCPCGRSCSHNNYARHQKTNKKHLAYIEAIG